MRPEEFKEIISDQCDDTVRAYVDIAFAEMNKRQAWRGAEGAGNWVEQMDIFERERERSRRHDPPEYTGEW